jgi:hypothetical protein
METGDTGHTAEHAVTNDAANSRPHTPTTASTQTATQRAVPIHMWPRDTMQNGVYVPAIRIEMHEWSRIWCEGNTPPSSRFLNNE